MSKNFSVYGLPEKVQFCKLCVNSNQKPNPVVEFKNNDNLFTSVHQDIAYSPTVNRYINKRYICY